MVVSFFCHGCVIFWSWLCHDCSPTYLRPLRTRLGYAKNHENYEYFGKKLKRSANFAKRWKKKGKIRRDSRRGAGARFLWHLFSPFRFRSVQGENRKSKNGEKRSEGKDYCGEYERNGKTFDQNAENYEYFGEKFGGNARISILSARHTVFLANGWYFGMIFERKTKKWIETSPR